MWSAVPHLTVRGRRVVPLSFLETTIGLLVDDSEPDSQTARDETCNHLSICNPNPVCNIGLDTTGSRSKSCECWDSWGPHGETIDLKPVQLTANPAHFAPTHFAHSLHPHPAFADFHQHTLSRHPGPHHGAPPRVWLASTWTPRRAPLLSRRGLSVWCPPSPTQRIRWCSQPPVVVGAATATAAEAAGVHPCSPGWSSHVTSSAMVGGWL